MQLKGILTNRDIRFQKNLDIPVSDIMTKENLITGKIGMNLQEAEKILIKHKVEKLPLVDKQNKLTGLITYKDIMKVRSRPNSCRDSLGRLRVGAAVGIALDTLDRVKAIAAGASSIMADSLFAGVEESVGETLIYEGRKYKTYRGMGSIEAMQKGSKDRYFQDTEEDIKKLVPEGIVSRVSFKGALSEVIYQLVGGLRSGIGYCGAKDIKTLQKKAKFTRITQFGIKESHPLDVIITKEAPNYSMEDKPSNQ